MELRIGYNAQLYWNTIIPAYLQNVEHFELLGYVWTNGWNPDNPEHRILHPDCADWAQTRKNGVNTTTRIMHGRIFFFKSSEDIADTDVIVFAHAYLVPPEFRDFAMTFTFPQHFIEQTARVAATLPVQYEDTTVTRTPQQRERRTQKEAYMRGWSDALQALKDTMPALTTLATIEEGYDLWNTQFYANKKRGK